MIHGSLRCACAVRMLKDELYQLSEPPAHVAEVAKVMSKTKCLVKVCAVRVCYSITCVCMHALVCCNAVLHVHFLTHDTAQTQPEGKHVVDIDPSLDLAKV